MSRAALALALALLAGCLGSTPDEAEAEALGDTDHHFGGEPGPQHVHALRERLREDRSSPLLLPPNPPLPVFLLVISSYMNFRRPNSSR